MGVFLGIVIALGILALLAVMTWGAWKFIWWVDRRR